MTDIICPGCGKAFKIDGSGYAEIVKQVRDRKESSWNHTIHLSKMISGGDGSAERITEIKARQLLPEAFSDIYRLKTY